jgi:hypothetical protein
VAVVSKALCGTSFGTSPNEGARCRPFTTEKLRRAVGGSIRRLDVRRGSFTLRERGPYARQHLDGFCSSTFKDQ